MISPKENMLRVLNHQEPDYLPLSSDIIVGISSIIKTASVGSKEEPVAYDWFGRKWIYEEKIGASCVDVNEPLLEDITQWKDVIRFPDLSSLDWEGAAARDTQGWDRENKLVRFLMFTGPWENLYYSMNFADALCALVTEEEACFEFFKAFADYTIELLGYVIKYYKPDIITLHDDYGMGTGLFMAPEVWRKLLKPNLKRIVDYVHSQGLIYQHHNCGYGASLAEEMADDLGIGSWQSVTLVNKPAELYKKIGHKVALIDGMMDISKLDADGITEEEIRQLTREAADAICPGGACAVISAGACYAHPERRAIVEDELRSYAQKYYRGKRPDDLKSM